MADNLSLTRWGVDSTTAATSNPADGVFTPGSASQGDLWLTTWSGEVINAYDQYKVFEGLVDSRTLTSGTTMQFPITGTVDLVSSWEAGQELTGGGSTTSTFTIGLDKRPIAAHFELDNIDVMIQQFEFRSELARQAGQTLANERDVQIANLVLQASAADSRVHTALNQGGVDSRFKGSELLTAADAGTLVSVESEAGALEVLAAIESELVRYRELNISEAGTVCVVKPGVFNQIRRLGIASPAAASSTMGYNDPMFAGVSTAMNLGSALNYMGCTIVQSNAMPENDESSRDANYATGAAPTNAADDPIALIFQRGCVASIKKQGLKVDSVEDVRRNSHFTVASMFSGGGVLRPELACALYVKA